MSRRSTNLLIAALTGIALAGCGGATQQIPNPTGVAGPDAGSDNPLHQGGFTDPTDPSSAGTLTGIALRGGAPAEGVVAHLFDETGAQVKTRTDASGAFSFSVAPAHYQLVLNDERGQGTLTNFVVFGGGVNDLGQLDLSPLESLPGIVDLYGIGFEERLTREAGDYQYPAYDSTRSAVYAARKLGGDLGYEILKVSIPDGAETTLATGQNLSSDYSSLLMLLDDTLLAYWAQRADPARPPYVYDSLVLVNTATGQELAVLPWDKLGTWFVEGGQFYFLETQDTRDVGNSLFGTLHQYTYSLVKLDPATGVQTPGPILSLGWASGFALVAHDPQQLVVVPQRNCDPQFAMSNPSECDNFVPGNSTVPSMYRVDLATLSDRYVTEVPGYTQGVLDGGAFYLLNTATSSSNTLTRIDLASGVKKDLVTTDCTTGRCFAGSWPVPLKNPKAEEMLVMTAQLGTTGQYANDGYARVDLTSGAVTELPMTAVVDGTSYTLCATSSCSAAYLPDGTVRITDTTGYGTTPRFATVEDVTASGAATARRFQIAATDEAPALFTSADGSHEVAELRDLSTGFTQLWSGAPGTSAAAMTPETFLTANHHDAALTTDGTTLFYFTRDPISGYEQLFRVQLDQN